MVGENDNLRIAVIVNSQYLQTIVINTTTVQVTANKPNLGEYRDIWVDSETGGEVRLMHNAF